jgi:hypothetical protein
MKKIRLLPLAVALLAVASAEAATTTPPSSFNVTANLTSVCSITNAPADVVFTYTSFQAGPSTATGGGFTVKCTNNLPYTMALDSGGGTVIGLAYTISIPTGTQTGSGADQPYTVSGSMVGGQGGNCALATCSGTQIHTLTVTY